MDRRQRADAGAAARTLARVANRTREEPPGASGLTRTYGHEIDCISTLLTPGMPPTQRSAAPGEKLAMQSKLQRLALGKSKEGADIAPTPRAHGGGPSAGARLGKGAGKKSADRRSR